MEKQIAGMVIDINEEGFMMDFGQWNESVGEAIAKENDITMSPRHWDVIRYIQSEYKNNVPLSIRKIGKSGVVDIKEFYQLFPDSPLKTASKISGIPKPVSCI